MPSLIPQRRYEPCGVGFSKQFIFDKNGGPALYVRGDEWETATAVIPEPLRSRLVRFWPGAEADPREILPSHLRSISEWLHEREMASGDRTSLRLDRRQVFDLPAPRLARRLRRVVVDEAEIDYASLLR